MLKRELSFLEKYKDVEGIIQFERSSVTYYNKSRGIAESHEVENDIVVAFSYDDFMNSAYSRIHGARHQCYATEEGIKICKKKDGEVVEEIKLNKKNNKPKETLPVILATSSKQSLKFIGMYNKLPQIEYIKFLSNPQIVLNNKEMYIWGSDCIHEYKIALTPVQNFEGFYYIPCEKCKVLEEFCKGCKEETLKISINENKLYIIDGNSFMSISLINGNKEEVIPCYVKVDEEYEFDKEIGKDLKSKLSKANKTVKESMEVTMRIDNGDVFLMDEKIFSLKSCITIAKPISGYKLQRFLQGADEDDIYISNNYLRCQNAYFII